MIHLCIREIAEQQGMSSKELARRSGLAHVTCAALWRNPHKILRTDTLDLLAQALGVDARDLISNCHHRPV